MNNSILKVIIVDDEELARKMLITGANWNALNMEIIGEAVSGQDVLAMMEEQLPDILFTDIKMPYMDGMELCGIVTRRYPHIKIVVTTAFKDFDYAHQCISLGISHFLLKPINRSDLLSTLLKLREQIENEKRQWREFDHLKEILEKNYSFLRERFLLEFCENSTRSASTEKQISYYFPNGIPSYIQVTLLEAHSSHAGNLTEEEHILQTMKNMEFIKKHLEGTEDIEILADNSHHIVLLTYSPKIQVISLCEQLQRSIFQTSGNEILFGIGNPYDNFYKAEISWLEALESLKFSRYMPNQPIVIYKNDIHVQDTGWNASPAELEDIKFYVKAGLPDSVQKLLPPLYLEPDGSIIGLEQARILSMTLLSSAVNAANDIGIPLYELFSDTGNSFIQILLETTSQNLRSQTCAFLTRLATEIAAYRADKSKSVLWDILQYIQAHLTDPSLSLGSVAETFHMNDSYLSRTFTKELGFSFSKYLNRLRMEHAITLLGTTDLKAYQIAEAVGIPDAYYFSNCFKKYTGKSIRDYKKGTT
ncbi:MAG: response regulator [Clostridium sp.]|nr:response regulator [Clostridium sp.]